ncbi:MAG: hypothetical protein ACRDAU_06315 [Clostridium sp.]
MSKLINRETSKLIWGNFKNYIVIGMVLGILSGKIPFVTFPITSLIMLNGISSVIEVGFIYLNLKKLEKKEYLKDDIFYGIGNFEKVAIFNIVKWAIILIGFKINFILGVGLLISMSMCNIVLANDININIKRYFKEGICLIFNMKGELIEPYIGFFILILFSEISFDVGYYIVIPYIIIAKTQIYLEFKEKILIKK